MQRGGEGLEMMVLSIMKIDQRHDGGWSIILILVHKFPIK